MTRTYSHWTPRYIFNRIVEKVYRFTHPDLPWLSPAANRYLQKNLKPSSVGLEFGSGHSTIWLGKHLKHLTSVEHSPVWFERVNVWLKKNALANVDYHLFTREADKEQLGVGTAYVNFIDTFQDEAFDFILVDGVYRAECANRVIPKLKQGGMLVIDNANLYLPCQSYSPHSRTASTGAASSRWQNFLDAVKGWQLVWTTNGVADTVIFLKPS